MKAYTVKINALSNTIYIEELRLVYQSLEEAEEVARQFGKIVFGENNYRIVYLLSGEKKCHS